MVRPAKKCITISRSFGSLVTTLEGMCEAVSYYAYRAGEKLSREKLVAGALMVFVLTNRFRDEPQYSNSATIELPVSADSTDELIQYSLRYIRSLYRKGFRFYKTGVILSDLVPRQPGSDRSLRHCGPGQVKRLMKANSRHGAGTLAVAAAGIKRACKTKFNRKSPQYTTRWEELREVKAV